MRFARFALLLFLLLFNISVWGQQTQPGTAPPPAPKDAQAISIVQQALAVAGGTTAIAAINDYTANGNITYHSDQDMQGSVTVQGLGLNQIRLDASLPQGVRSWTVTAGQMNRKLEDGSGGLIYSQIAMHLSGLVVPYLELNIGVISPAFALSNNGLVVVDGHSAYDIQVKLVGSGLKRPMNLADFYVRDYFVDAVTFQVVMTQDLAPKHVLRQLQYADFRPIGGVLVPFSISEVAGGQQTWTMQISQITFNTGLQDSAFALQ